MDCKHQTMLPAAFGELLRLRGLFDAGTLDALLAAARSSMHFETDADTVDGSATYHASIVEAERGAAVEDVPSLLDRLDCVDERNLAERVEALAGKLEESGV